MSLGPEVGEILSFSIGSNSAELNLLEYARRLALYRTICNGCLSVINRCFFRFTILYLHHFQGLAISRTSHLNQQIFMKAKQVYQKDCFPGTPMHNWPFKWNISIAGNDVLSLWAFSQSLHWPECLSNYKIYVILGFSRLPGHQAFP
jgi:hypothetical protein